MLTAIVCNTCWNAGGKDDVPSNPGDEKLVDMHSFQFAFIQNAFFASATGLVTYFAVSAAAAAAAAQRVMWAAAVDGADAAIVTGSYAVTTSQHSLVLARNERLDAMPAQLQLLAQSTRCYQRQHMCILCTFIARLPVLMYPNHVPNLVPNHAPCSVSVYLYLHNDTVHVVRLSLRNVALTLYFSILV